MKYDCAFVPQTAIKAVTQAFIEGKPVTDGEIRLPDRTGIPVAP